MRYRPEIDGLRAVAVLPVVLFHADLALFSGGFVGVDIFFVLSGYLITTLILQDLEHGRFSITDFYERRARRILPALFVMMLTCLPFAWAWMSGEQARTFLSGVLGTVFFVSNIVFWQRRGYFEPDNSTNPLLHTWSLSVEEQFYLIFPVAMILLWRLGRRPAFLIVVAMFLISLAMSEWGWRNEPNANFYLAPTRAWELLAGSICAFLIRDGFPDRFRMQGLGTIGLAMIVASIFYYDKSTPFPSVYALLPVGGTALVILFARTGTSAANILSWRPFVALGLISYSVYLWHQPLQAFTRIRMVTEPTETVMMGVSLLSLGIGWASWRYVEKPFRASRGWHMPRAAIFRLSGAFGLALALIGAGWLAMGGVTAQAALRLGTAKEEHVCSFFGPLDVRQIQECRDQVAGKPVVVLVGDSHAMVGTPAMRDALRPEGIELVSLAYSSCLPIPGVERGGAADAGCRKFTGEVYPIAQSFDPEAIVVASYWTAHLLGDTYSRTSMEEALPTAVAPVITAATVQRPFDAGQAITTAAGFLRQLAADQPVLIIGQVPEVGLDARKAMMFAPEMLEYSYADYLTRTAMLHSVFEGVDRTSDGIRFFSPGKVLCPDLKTCRQSEGGALLYSDNNHLSVAGSRKLTASLAPELLEFLDRK
ncbi:acyltransferase family protein [uncultured Paracoccus sp.]|uniref:acyltransferase family protein n=1 Tax=uncultured Paracoccus sp. TaxID=189685 RepID=UPI0025FF1EF9|nr:acyltransferase family protein [uncultured Paracoccus sp.]